MNRKKLNEIDEDENIHFSAISKLIELGQQKAYITIDDILHFFPEAEQDVSQLEEAFAALMAAGIPYLEDDDLSSEPTEDDFHQTKLKKSPKKHRKLHRMI